MTKEEMIKKIRDGECHELNLRGADLRGAYLCDVDLGNANLRGADLCNANLCGANLWGADLWDANLGNTNLRDADLRYADLRGVNLRNADLRNANLGNANLRGADLGGVSYNESTTFIAVCCPEEGSFVGYKKCREDKIVKILITEDAKRSSATTRKCRASKVKVLSIENVDGTESYDEAVSIYDSEFTYLVGKIIEVKDFNEDRWEECAAGIHFFITRDEAVRYSF